MTSSKLVLVASILSIGAVVSSNAAIPFSDNFNTSHNYFSNGVSGTGWDGIINSGFLGSGSSATGGSLTWTSSGDAGWENSNNRGPLLYVQATGNFSMSVEQFGLTGGSFPTGGMVVWSNADDWLHYAANFLGNNFVRSTVDGTSSGTSANPSLRFQRIDRVGNDFTFYMKANSGDSWGAPLHTVTRSDFPATLNIGLSMGNYGGGASTLQYDNFSVVPEPSSALLIASGFGVMGLIRRRRA